MKITVDLLKAKSLQFQLRFKGYSLTPRSKFLLVIKKDLSVTEYFLYSLLFDVIADWDDRHSLYGTFEFNIDLFASWIDWSTSKLRRLFRSLIKKGFIQELGANRYFIVGFKLKKLITQKGFDFYREIKNIVSNSENNINNVEKKYVENNKK